MIQNFAILLKNIENVKLYQDFIIQNKILSHNNHFILYINTQTPVAQKIADPR